MRKKKSLAKTPEGHIITNTFSRKKFSKLACYLAKYKYLAPKWPSPLKSGYREYSPCLVNMKDHRPPSCTLQFHLQMWHRTLSPPYRIQPTKWSNTGKKESTFLSSKLCEERWKRRPCTLACLTCKYHHKQHSIAQNPVAQNKHCIINKEHDAHSRSITLTDSILTDLR